MCNLKLLNSQAIVLLDQN